MSRGGDGYDFTPILTHYLFLTTSILAAGGWFIAFIGQAVATAQLNNAFVGVVWFAIFVQLLLILGVLHTLASDAVSLHRFQISIFGAICIVFAVIGVNEGIFAHGGPGAGALNAMGAGWLILAMVDILWVLYFTSEENSLALHLFNRLGTGGLSPPGRQRRRTRTGSGMDMAHGDGGVGYTGTYADGGIPSATGSGGGGYRGGGIGNTPDVMGPAGLSPVRSQASLGVMGGGGGGGGDTSMGMGAGMGLGAGMASMGQASRSNATIGKPQEPASPRASTVGEMEKPPGTEEQLTVRAKALYAYQASPDDPNEISFAKGEILEIVDKQGKWWQARKTDGASGIAPSNYLQVI